MTDLAFLEQPADVVAPLLLGWRLARTDAPEHLVGMIVETEAYDQADAASHSYRGRTPRTEVMFGDPGHLYVYFTYGMHYCCNIVTGSAGYGAAVLIRGIEPIQGIQTMAERRRGSRGAAQALPHQQITNGPAKLCQAYGIDTSLNGHDLTLPPLQLLPPESGAGVQEDQITQTTRIGISQATDVPWRFYIRGNPYVSKSL